MQRVAQSQLGDDAETRRWLAAIERVYRTAAIRSRASVLADFAREPHAFSFFPKNWALEPPPTTRARMAVYRDEAPRLAQAAAERCLEDGFRREAITDLIVVSCTGFYAPGLDIELVDRLQLPAGIRRQTIGFMGCYAGITALRTAATICRSEPDAAVLVVCVELCTLHFQRDLNMDNVLANCLFSDGAAAALVAGAGRTGDLEIVAAHSAVDADGVDHMTWTVTDAGFRMTLSAEVPERLRQAMPAFAETLLARSKFARESVTFWALHPGGRRILEAVEQQLGLTRDETGPSWDVLSDHGNMSSATILFVLDRWRRRELSSGSNGVAMAFGPGLTLESLSLRVA
jgi:predicted naringenin-chalcone synthase